MKKMLSLLLALLMLALPVFSCAEETVAVSSISGMKPDFAQKYLAQGQEEVTTISLVPGDLLLGMVGEEYGAAISELLAALAIQTKAQTADGKAQGSFSLQLSGEDAISLTVAASNDGLFASSNLLGEETYMLTGEELKELLNQFAQSLVAQGAITQAQLDGFTAQFAAFAENPEAAISALIGNVDPTGLQNALTPIMSGITQEAVTEAPELLPDAVMVVTVPLKKADLAAVMEEIAKLLWSMPITQQLASSSGESMTEEKLIDALKKVPDALAEDTALQIYMNETGDKVYVTTDMKLTANGEEAEMAFDMVIAMLEAGMNLNWALNVTDKEENVLMSGDMNVADTHMDYTVTVDATEDGKAWRPLEVIADADFTSQEDSFALGMTVTERIKNDPDSDAVGIVVSISGIDQDKGDHAEGQATVAISLENMGDLLTINVSEMTGEAEAWITDANNAVRPMAMTGEEQAALGEKVMNSLQLGLITAMQKLPASVLQIVNSLMNPQ